jgi:uncharacterized protein YndB with AHSA1/START domain
VLGVSDVRAIVCVVSYVSPRRVLRFEADYSVAPEVVWDALADPVLIEGWLGEVVIDAAPEGEYSLTWRDGAPQPAVWDGTIVVIAPPKGRATAVLELAFSGADSSGQVGIRFELSRVPAGGGHSGTHVLLEYVAFLDAAEVDPVEKFWWRRLRYLADLLRGRPREWAG